uniref:Uncharacterized protein n=1 Tax=Anguilla anguilla TaxID=7936 RepID=A0A0E9UIG1_ANGAN
MLSSEFRDSHFNSVNTQNCRLRSQTLN